MNSMQIELIGYMPINPQILTKTIRVFMTSVVIELSLNKNLNAPLLACLKGYKSLRTMHKFYPGSFRAFFSCFFLLGLLVSQLHAQSFSQSELNLNGNDFAFGVTSLMYGPDGRLYVAEYPTGAIKILSVQRNSDTDYEVIAIETLNGIQTMADHNDDGTLHTEVNRQVTGLTVAGTAANPIIYVSSSDVRIGSGEGVRNAARRV